MNLNVCDGHVDIGGEDRDQEQGQTPSGQSLHPRRRDEESRSAQQLEDAAKLNAGDGKGDPRRHDGKKKGRVEEMVGSGKEKECGQEQPDDKSENQGGLPYYKRHANGSDKWVKSVALSLSGRSGKLRGMFDYP